MEDFIWFMKNYAKGDEESEKLIEEMCEDWSQDELEEMLHKINYEDIVLKKELRDMSKKRFDFTFYDKQGKFLKAANINFKDITHDYKSPLEKWRRVNPYFFRLMHKGESLCYFEGGGNTEERLEEIYNHHRIEVGENFMSQFNRRIYLKETLSIRKGGMDIIEYQLKELQKE